MSWINNLKQKYYQKQLAVALKSDVQQSDKLIHLNTAKRICILFPADKSDMRRDINRWRDDAKRKHQHIEVLGYFSNDVGEATFDFQVVTVNDLNWYGIPKAKVIAAFQANPCDLLIRLGQSDEKELDYLAALKTASLKVGPMGSSDSIYHLLFEADKNDKASVQLRKIADIFSYTNL